MIINDLRSMVTFDSSFVERKKKFNIPRTRCLRNIEKLIHPKGSVTLATKIHVEA